MNHELPRSTKELPKHCVKIFDQTLAWLPPTLDYVSKDDLRPRAETPCSRKCTSTKLKRYIVSTHLAKPFSVILHLPPFKFSIFTSSSSPFLFLPFHLPIVPFCSISVIPCKNLSYLCHSWSWAQSILTSLFSTTGVLIKFVFSTFNKCGEVCFFFGTSITANIIKESDISLLQCCVSVFS